MKYPALFLAGVATACSPLVGQDVFKWPTRKDGPCEYHPIPADARAMVATIPTSSENLKSDGLGAYWQGNDTVRSYLGGNGVNYMLFTYWPETCDEPLPRKLRFLEYKLDSPEPGAKAMGVIRDQTAMLYIFPQDSAINDIRVGQTVTARQALLRFHRDDKIYYLRMGTVPFPRPLGGYVERLPGQGSTTASITRESETKWVITAAPGSLARLSIWGPEPVDLGLYRFSFEIEIRVQRPETRRPPNKALEPTPGSVTPRASVPKSK
jgi:hypothetical protein